MDFDLTEQQKRDRTAFRIFARENIAPYADQFDQEEVTPGQVIHRLAERGYIGGIIPEQWGGLGLDMLTYGLLNEEIGWACSSIRSLLTVHDMLSYAILKCGTELQRQKWLLRLAQGEVIGGLAVSEPNVGRSEEHTSG